MSNSVAVVYIDDELAVPKTLKAAHRFWDKLPFANVPANTKILSVHVKFDRGAPGSPSTFTDIYSGHDSFGLAYLPGLEGGGITVVQYDTVGSGSGQGAKVKTRGGSLDGKDDTGLTPVERELIDLVMMNSNIVLVSYDILASDFNDLVVESFTMDLPDPT